MLKWLGSVALIGAIAFGAGWKVCSWRSTASEVKQVIKVATVDKKNDVAVQKIATDNATKQTEIKYVTQTITKEIPVYVTPKVDTDFPLSIGFVRVHNAATQGVDVSSITDPAGRSDEAASTVTESDASRTIVGNYGDCRADKFRLTQFQEAWKAIGGKWE